MTNYETIKKYGSLAAAFYCNFKKALKLIKNKKALPYAVLFRLTATSFDDDGLCDIFDHPADVYNGFDIYDLIDNKTPLTKNDRGNVKNYLKRVLDYERLCLWVDDSKLNDKQRMALSELIKGL